MIIKKTKAQLKMAENIAVLLIFFLIIGFGLIFYGAAQLDSIDESKEEAFDKEAVRVALTASFLPELLCTIDNHVTYNCVDLEKVYAFTQKAQSAANDREMFLFYESDFRDSKLTIRELFPGDTEWIIYDNSPDNFTDMTPTYIPINIRDPMRKLDKQDSFGLLTVEVYK